MRGAINVPELMSVIKQVLLRFNGLTTFWKLLEFWIEAGLALKPIAARAETNRSSPTIHNALLEMPLNSHSLAPNGASLTLES